MGRIEDLERLKQLKESGTLTDEEFEREKSKTLNSTEEVKPINKQASKLGYLFAIVTVISAILFIWYLLSDIQHDYNNNMQKLDDMKNSMYFNCPYCKSYVTIKRKDAEDGSCICPNCRKFLKLDANRGTVTYWYY